MKFFNKVLVVSVLVVSLIFSFTGSTTANAATAPNLGVAAGYSVFGNAGITETVGQNSRLWGNAGGNGFGHANLIASQVTGSIDAGANASVVSAISAAYGNLAGEAQTGAINLALSPTVTPGVYDIAATAFNSTLTLNGDGVYIFRSTSSIAQTAGGTMVLTNGATACKVYWQIPTSMTFAAAGTIEGTIITNTGLISFVSGVNLKGRAWAATQVTMDNNQITEPTCAAAAAATTGRVQYNGTIAVIKTVINDSGGIKVPSDFLLYINNAQIGAIAVNTFPVSTDPYIVKEAVDPKYTRTFSGDCDVNGNVYINNPGDTRVCVITNNDIGTPLAVVPPLIDVVKVPSPLALPVGPGPVTFTYTLRNIGTVPVTNVTMVGDTCSPITLVSGDVNADAKLDVNETWTYRCSKTVSETHTNTVVTTGWANGISANDVASATVVVGAPAVPPLIHIVKKPNVFVRTSSGPVTYNYTVTNPGTAPLSNVFVTDDKCTGLPGRVVGHPGDLNKNNLLESNEVWSFTCQTNLTQSTTNVGTAKGSANGLTATDFSPATVVVAAPKLPKTGVGSDDKSSSAPWNIIIPTGIFVAIFSLYLARRNQII